MSGAAGWTVSWNPAGLSWAIKTLSKQILSAASREEEDSGEEMGPLRVMGGGQCSQT